MAPTELEILTSYLVQPAPLTAMTTLERFSALFTRAPHAAPPPPPPAQLRALFRDLQTQRNAVVDAVAANVAAEARRGAALRRLVVRRARAPDHPDDDPELHVERALVGCASGVAPAPAHSLRSVVPELDGAAAALEAEISQLEEEHAALLAAVTQTVGGLSDLRYGKLANNQLGEQVLDGLQSLQDACQGKS